MRLFILANIVLMISGTPAFAQEAPSAASPVAAAVVSGDGFKVGETTFEAVKAKLGKPFSIMANSDGTRVAIYTNTKTKIKGSSFIPIVGMFTAGAKSTVATKSFTFDQRDILKSFSSSETTADCHTTVVGYKCQ